MVALKINNIVAEALDQLNAGERLRKSRPQVKPQRHISQKILLVLSTEQQKEGRWLYLGNYILKSTKCKVNLTN